MSSFFSHTDSILGILCTLLVVVLYGAEWCPHMTIDEALYSRQLYVLGHEAMQRMQRASVLVLGMRGLGVEVAKNCCLAGVQSVDVYDPDIVEQRDLGLVYGLSEAHLGHPRDQSCVPFLAELNRYVPVRVLSQPITAASLAQYAVVVATRSSIEESMALNALCRQAGAGFVAALAPGLVASLFVDLGPQMAVADADGEEPKQGLVASISSEERGRVVVHEEARHGLVTGDRVEFAEMEGASQFEGRVFEVKYESPFSFRIGDTRGLGSCDGEGRFVQVKQPQTFTFDTLEETWANPVCVPTDFSKMDSALQLHCLVRAIKRQAHPARPDTLEDATRIVQEAQQLAQQLASPITLDIETMTQLARCSAAEIAPMASFLGGVTAQEVLKACTGKFSPLQQYLYFDARECLADAPLSDYALQNSRYDDQVAVFGLSMQEQLARLRLFLVGSGAIGCEMLKNWASMGVATKGGVVVTDMDTIERSNLNRQFLFRPHDVGQLKSRTAARAAQQMNPRMQVTAHANRVGTETEDVYDDAFWNEQDMVCTALDNVEARLYCDQRCVLFQKPMLESGTLGTKGNTQVVVPKVTESYGSTRDPVEAGIPVCTLKNFPNKPEHVIQWARDAFEGMFKQAPDEANAFLTRKSYLTDLEQSPNTEIESLKTVLSCLVDDRPSSFYDCVVWARQLYETMFHNTIAQLLFSFPLDSTTSSGTKFWSGPKRAPYPLSFDASDSTSLDFIAAAAHLRAHVYGLSGSTDRAMIASMATEAPLAPFDVDPKAKIATTEEELKEAAEEGDDKEEVQELVSRLPRPSTMAGFQLNPITFEKDDDTNFHMQFVTACANLRARNYRIPEQSVHETKRIAGKIIPAIATTTALVSGLICLEMYKIVQHAPLDKYRCAFVNLALPFCTLSEPRPPATTTVQIRGEPWEWSLWDTVDIHGKDMTLKQLLRAIEEKLGLEVSMLSYGACMLYSFFGNKKKLKARMGQPVTEVAASMSKTPLNAGSHFLLLEAIVTDDDGEDVDIPSIRYIFK